MMMMILDDNQKQGLRIIKKLVSATYMYKLIGSIKGVVVINIMIMSCPQARSHKLDSQNKQDQIRKSKLIRKK